MKDWSKKVPAFLLGAVMMGILSFIATSNAQSPFVKLVMRFGDERVLEDGTKVRVSKGDGDLIIVTLSRPASVIARKNVTGSDGGAGLASDLSNSDPAPYLWNYEAQASGTYKISEFSGNQNGIMKIEIDVSNTDSLKAKFSFHSLSGELSGKYDNGRLRLQGVGFLNSLTERPYQCSITSLMNNRNLTEGKYYCEAGSDVIQGSFKTALRTKK